ncbi:MAG: M20/M25/M40 family metallo-hydrolase, partial [Longimicrobiales bacterium]|nr:M20/M25/M40 family metallo-hydrolase [Longimicrobiales bacterium]
WGPPAFLTQRKGPMKKLRRPLLTVAAAAALATLPPALAPLAAQSLADDDPVLRAIWDRAMNDSHLEPLAQALLDSIGPRLTGSPGMARAQEWAVRTLAGWGVEARLEEYGTWLGWDRGPSHIDLMAPRVRSLEGRILAWSPGTGGRPVEGGAAVLPPLSGPADFQAFLGEVRGRYVMLSYPQPTCRADEQWEEFALPESLERMQAAREAGEAAWNAALRATGLDRRELPRALEEAGALGVVSSTWPGSYGTTRVFNAFTREVPTFELSCEDYGLVYRLAERGQGPVLRVTAEAEFLGEVPVANVVGVIPGTELPDEYVVLSAHFDSWEGGSGATDNGTGSVLMMEAMRILTEVYPNPRRTILIGLWNGEEQGLNGSRAFVEDNPDVAAGLQALFNQDNGTGRVVNMSASGFTEAGSSLARWLSRVPREVTRHINLQLPGNPSSGGTDHASFVCVPAPGFSLGALSWDYGSHTWHTHRDTFDKLSFDDLRNNAVLVASLAYLASEDPERVSRETRDVLAGPGGQSGSWPVCQPAVRRSSDSSRM